MHRSALRPICWSSCGTSHCHFHATARQVEHCRMTIPKTRMGILFQLQNWWDPCPWQIWCSFARFLQCVFHPCHANKFLNWQCCKDVAPIIQLLSQDIWTKRSHEDVDHTNNSSQCTLTSKACCFTKLGSASIGDPQVLTVEQSKLCQEWRNCALHFNMVAVATLCRNTSFAWSTCQLQLTIANDVILEFDP